MKARCLTEFQEILNILVKLELQYVRRIGGSRNFGFGKLRKTVNRRGETCEIAQYALHTSCAWRIEGSCEILTCSNDVWYSVDGEFHDRDDQQNDETLQSVQLKKLFSGKEKLVVKSADLNAWGDLRIEFSQDYHLVLFNDASQHTDGEAWVFFPPEETERFFITIPRDL